MSIRRKPWDKREGESNKAYDAFSMYLEMSDRSVRKVADLLSKKRQQIYDWSKKFDWQERAAAYDSSVVEALRKDRIKRKKKIIQRLSEIGFLMVEKAEEAFKACNSQRITPRTATDMVDVASRVLVQMSEFEGEEESVTDSTLTVNIVRAGEGDIK